MPRRNGGISVLLKPGEWFVGDARHRISTLLGSCVSMTLWHPQRRIGAMSHFLLPTRGARDATLPLEGRFGDEALILMLDLLARRGINPHHCEAKLFGGGNMFPGHFRDEGAVGRKNGDAARVFLEEAGLRVRSSNLYGAGHRQIVFDVSTGAVWVRHVALATNERLSGEVVT